MSNSKPPWFRCLCKHLLNERICWVIELRVFDCTCTSQKWQLIRSLWNYVYCQIWLSFLCSAVRIAIKHQSSDLQVPSLNAQQGLLFSWIAINFYYLIFSNVPNEHMLELHISLRNIICLGLYAELFSKVWRTLLLTLTTIYCHLYAVKYFF